MVLKGRARRNDRPKKIIRRILDHEGIMDELGHFSVRVPGKDRVLINGKVSPGQAVEEDIILLDLNGNKLDGRLEAAKEIPLHLAVCRKRPDVMAIAHTHSPMIVALSAAGVRLRAMDNLGATAFGRGAPIFEECGKSPQPGDRRQGLSEGLELLPVAVEQKLIRCDGPAGGFVACPLTENRI